MDRAPYRRIAKLHQTDLETGYGSIQILEGLAPKSSKGPAACLGRSRSPPARDRLIRPPEKIGGTTSMGQHCSAV